MSRLNVLLIVCGFSLLSGGASGHTVWHVNDDASPGGNGSSWCNAYKYLQNAYKYLQDALAVADGGDEIRVAGGIYRRTATRPIT